MNDREYEVMYRVEDSLWWYVGMRRITEAVLAHRLPDDGRILDAGCGTGGNTVWLERFGVTYGVDSSALAVSFCRQRGLTRVSQASVVDLPFGDSTFDGVTSFDVISQLGVHDDVEALREIRRVLRPGGWALVRVPAMPKLRSEHDVAVHTRQRYTVAELTKKVRSAGLEITRATYANVLLFPAAAMTRMLRRARAREAAGAVSDVHPVPRSVNALLGAVLSLEARLLSRFDLPFGLSAIALARRAL